MKEIRNILLIVAACLCVATVFAQSTTYTIGQTNCGPASTVWIDCYSMPLILGNTTTTAWIEADYPPYTSEEFLVFHSGSGDYALSSMQVLSSMTYNGRTFPTEITANLTAVDGTEGAGTLDLKIAYTIGRISRWATGPVANTSGGTVTTVQ